MWTSLPILLTVFSKLWVGFAHPVDSESFGSFGSRLERRTLPGSYALYTPKDDGVVYDFEANSFCFFVKFGDGRPKRINDYVGRNPTFGRSYRYETTAESNGKKMESVLTTIARSNPSKVVHLRNSSGKRHLEWYQIFVGKELKEARKAKRAFRQRLDDYKNLPRNNRAEAKYQNAFRKLIADYATIAIDKPLVDVSEGAGKRKRPVAPSGDPGVENESQDNEQAGPSSLKRVRT
ncbi:hypothetical protein H0H92_004548 [Tricholoma furcatifolium]|nr:hypothetical protein H0H92_004548 [Tricholoma furcatifolium]